MMIMIMMMKITHAPVGDGVESEDDDDDNGGAHVE
jgi:hypothetical protein